MRAGWLTLNFGTDFTKHYTNKLPVHAYEVRQGVLEKMGLVNFMFYQFIHEISKSA